MDLAAKLKALEPFPLFSTLSHKDATEFAAITEEKEFYPGEILLRQDDESYASYIILKGFVKVYRTTEAGKNIWLAMVGPNALVGELGLFDNSKRSASAEAMQPTTTLMLQKAHLTPFLLTHPKVSIVFLTILSNRLRTMNQRIENLTSRTLTERTVMALNFLEDYYPNGVIQLSHEQLAELLGATRPRVSEILEDLEKQHLISMNNRSITLLR